jgi:hypothetical protein
LVGFLYWYGLYPFHGAIFGNLIKAISERAEAMALAESPTSSAVQA